MGLDHAEERLGLQRNASHIATGLIRQAIFGGRLQPGQRLKADELAQELGISRTPVREALLILQAEGLVSANPNRGAVVRCYSEEELLDMYDIRALLESYGASRGANGITAEQLETLKASCVRFSELCKARDIHGVIRENALFHSTIAEAAGSVRLGDLIRSATELPLVYRSFFWFSDSEFALSDSAHRNLVERLAAGDSEGAEAIMKEHIYAGRDFVIARFKDGDSRPAEVHT